MRYISEFRDGRAAAALARSIAAVADPARSYHLMEFCGGHTHAISRYGIPDLLPSNLSLVHGPGCPVCVLATPRLDAVIELAADPNVILVSYGDLLRVPGSRKRSLLKARARGADIRIAVSSLDALDIAASNPTRQVVFFAIGFETTTPATAVLILEARRRGLRNLAVYCNHVLTPAAIQSILDSPGVAEIDRVRIDGFIGPSHVSTLIGSKPYEPFAAQYRRPVVIAGFEPLDVMQAILMLVQQLNDGRAQVENQFTRGVTREGNAKAQGLVAEVFELRPHVRVAWTRAGSLQWPANPVRLRGVRCRAPLRADPASDDREPGLSVPLDHPGIEEADGLHDLRYGVHAAQPHRFVHGVIRGSLRGVL